MAVVPEEVCVELEAVEAYVVLALLQKQYPGTRRGPPLPALLSAPITCGSIEGVITIAAVLLITMATWVLCHDRRPGPSHHLWGVGCHEQLVLPETVVQRARGGVEPPPSR